MNIIFLGPAEAELLDAIVYYNSQSEGLVYEFAAEVKRTIERIVQYPEVGQIIKAERSITAETAVKLGKFFSVPAKFWMNLQTLYDLEEPRSGIRKILNPFKQHVSFRTQRHRIVNSESAARALFLCELK